MTARDFTPTDEQVEALCRTDFESDQSVLRWDEDCISKPEWREDMRFLIASPAFQSIIAAAKAEALRDAVEAHTVIVTGLIRPQDLLDEADYIEGKEASA